MDLVLLPELRLTFFGTQVDPGQLLAVDRTKLFFELRHQFLHLLIVCIYRGTGFTPT
jgi:hypothetical protein